MSQPLITRFYNKRKRAAEGLATGFSSKILVLDNDYKISSTDNSLSSSKAESCNEVNQVTYRMQGHGCTQILDKTVSNNSELQSHSKYKDKLYVVKTAKSKKTKCGDTSQRSQTDIRLAFKPKTLENVCNTPAKSTEIPVVKNESNVGRNVDVVENSSAAENKVVFELRGMLSPKRKNGTNDQESPNPNKRNEIDEIKNARKELGLMTPKKEVDQNSKAMSFNDIRNKLNRSSRLTEIRESIKRFNKGEQHLKEIENQKKKLEASPRLRQFTSIDLEVPLSPQKFSSSGSLCVNSFDKGSPIKSPLKSPLKTNAYQRFAHLIQPGTPALALPYTYRMLAEIFRCMDTVTSMLYNRKENVTFTKLKLGVQQMMRRNFTEQHLGQIKNVLPNAFHFSQEKCPISASSKKISYELIITPVIDSVTEDVSRIRNNNFQSVMTPSLLVQRRESFHKSLLEIVKDHHEEFLINLNPPVHVSRSSLARWHPNFDLEKVPAVLPAELPASPTEEKLCTAKDVLDRAKTLFSCNQRMEKALLMVSEQMSKSEKPSPTSANVNSGSNSFLLKGIPKALLEKVRAKQAAKALLTMTRTADEDREAIKLQRLPEISRILRNIFVAEKKNVLALEAALNKLSSSYREALSAAELEEHVRLLKKVVPDWVEILHIRKTDYIKISKDANMSTVIGRLEKLIAEKNNDI